jgi:hypothetical protein
VAHPSFQRQNPSFMLITLVTLVCHVACFTSETIGPMIIFLLQVTLSLCLINCIGGLEVRLCAFLTPPLYGSVWLVSRPGRFTAKERAHGSQWIGSWGEGGSRADLDSMVKRKKSYPCPCRESNPSRPARSLVTILTELLEN